MIEVSPKATKAELLQVLETANACLHDQAAKIERMEAAGTDWATVRRFIAANAVVAWKEFRALTEDTYRAGTAARQWFSATVDALSRPVLRSKE
jgi:hypothetical protein